MAEDVGSLVARVVADTEGFRSEMTRLARTVESNTARMNASLSRIGKASDAVAGSFRLVTRVAGAFGVALSVRALTQFTMQSINAAAELQNLSVRLNASVESLSELQYVAKLTDVDFQSFTQSLQIMNRNFGEAAKGSKAIQQTFRQLGLDFQLLSSLTVDQQLEAVAEALNRVGNESLQAALRQEVFGRGGAAMQQALEGGAEAIRAMRQEARDLGAVMTGDMAKGADEAKDAIDRLKASVQPLINELVVNLAPIIEKVADALRRGFFPTDVDRTKDAIYLLNVQIASTNEELSDLQGKMDRGEFVFPDAAQRKIDGLRNVVRGLKLEVQDLEFSLPIPGAEKPPGSSVVPGLVTPGGGGDGLQEITVAAERMEAMRSMEQMFHEQVGQQRDAAMAANVSRMQQEVAAWDDYVQERKRQEEELAEFQHYKRMETLANTGYVLDVIMNLSQGHSKKMFQFAKAAAIANAIINTAQGATKALAQGGFAGIAMAAAVIASGAAQISSIRGTSFSGSGAGGGLRAGGGSGSVPTLEPSQIAQEASTAARQTATQVIFRGDFYGFDDMLKRKLIDSLRDAIDGQDVVIIGRDSRQAALLAGT